MRVPFNLVRLALVLLSCAVVNGVHADTYPSKPIRLVVPFAPGGTSDVVARIVGQQLSQKLGQAVVVENKPGAGGTLAAAEVARSAADGYTLLLVAASHAGSAALYPSLPYDPVKDFASVIGLASFPIVVAVGSTSKFKTMPELLAYARANPGKLNYAGGGGGATMTSLAAEVFRTEARIDAIPIPYKGSAPALTALISGEVDFAFDGLSVFSGMIGSGQVRPLAVASAKRLASLPNVPTLSETIAQNFEAASWNGILAPKGTPKPVVDRLNRELNAILKKPEIISRFAQLGGEVTGGTPESFGKYIAEESIRWGAVIKRLGLKAE